MSLLVPAGHRTFYSAGAWGYSAPRINDQMRGRTIAGFRVAQKRSNLTTQPMQRDLLAWVLSPAMMTYWIKQRWVVELSSNLVQLTPEGLAVCQDSLHPTFKGKAVTKTTEAIVDEWVQRMKFGDEIATEPREFELL